MRSQLIRKLNMTRVKSELWAELPLIEHYLTEDRIVKS